MRRATRAVSSLLVVVLVVAGLTAVVPSAAAQPARERFIVVLRDDVADPAAVADELGRRHGGAVGHVYRFALKGFAVELPAPAVEALARDPRVAFVEPDQLAFAVDVPTGVDRIEGDKKLGTNPADVNVDIAIIDTGIAPHGDLTIAGGVNCTGGNVFFASCTQGNPGDDNGHGTHVAGSAAANGGVVGVAPGARLHAVKVLRANGSGYISAIVAGIDWVTARANTIEVANMSLGCQCSSTAMNTAITNSTNAGVVYVVAAGNDAMNASNFSPANHGQTIAVSAMADFDGLAGGGAPSTCRSDVDDTLADFSNFGSVVDLAAPGVCIRSTWPGGGYNTISGTSMASPHAAGAAALYVVQNSVPKSPNRWSTVRSGLRGTGWSVAQTNACGFTGGLSGEPFLMLATPCDSAPGEPDTPPTAEAVSVATDEDAPVAVTLSGSDAETCQLQFAIAGGPANGSLSGITGAACTGTGPFDDSATVTYTPNPNASGTDSFTYTVKDAATTSAPATVSITINPVNDAPTAGDDAYGTDQDVPLNVAAPGVLGNDSDVDGGSLTAGLVSNVTNGALTLNADGSFSYTPNAGFFGTDGFTYSANDGTAVSNIATVTLTVNRVAPPNDPPTVSIASPTGGTVSGTITVRIAASDTEDATGTLTVSYAVDGGAPVPAAYNGATGFYEAIWDTTLVGDGPHTLTALATDSAGQTTSAPVGVTVSNPVVPVPPAAPTNLTANPNGRGLRLTWTDNAANETGYRVTRSDGTNTVVFELGPNATEFRDRDTVSGTTYDYTVAAWNVAGEGAATVQVTDR